MNHSPPVSPVHGIFPVRILEWAAISFSEGWGGEGLPNPEIKPTSPECLLPCRQILYHWATRENTHLYWMVRTPQNCQRHQKFKSLRHLCSQKREPEEPWQLNVMWFLDETLKQERTFYSQRIQSKIEALVFLFLFFFILNKGRLPHVDSLGCVWSPGSLATLPFSTTGPWELVCRGAQRFIYPRPKNGPPPSGRADQVCSFGRDTQGVMRQGGHLPSQTDPPHHPWWSTWWQVLQPDHPHIEDVSS